MISTVFVFLLLLQFIASEVNIFMWDESEKDVTSNIFILNLAKCYGGGSRRKRSTELVPSIPYLVDRLPTQELAQPQLVNETAMDMNIMFYHYMNVSIPLNPVLVTVIPVSKNNKLEVFVNINSVPTPDDHLLRVVVPQGDNSTGANASVIDDDLIRQLYSIYISVDLLRNHTNQSGSDNVIQIGIRNFDTGNFCPLFHAMFSLVH